MGALKYFGGLGLSFGAFLTMEAAVVMANVTAPRPFASASRPHLATQVRAPRHDSDTVLRSDLRRQVVPYKSDEKPGTVIVDIEERRLYFLLPDNTAIRYGIGTPRKGFEWSGVTTIARKAKWPVWTPPAAMIRREPAYAAYAAGMPGGADNPLGARALYLYSGGKDTLYRIHGTSEPWTIGQQVSSGCLRMLNAHVIELYELAKTGAKVLVR